MTISKQKRFVKYVGDGATTVFPYDFLVPDASSLKVYIYDTVTFLRTLVTPSQYTVTGIDDPSGGEVTYPLAGDELPSTKHIIISREVPYLQELDIVNQGGFFPEPLEDQLDEIVMQTIQLADEVSRSLRTVEGEDFEKFIPGREERKGKLLMFDGVSGEPQASAIDGEFNGFDQALNTTDSPVFNGLLVNSLFEAKLPLVGTGMFTHIGRTPGFVDGSTREIPTVDGFITFQTQVSDYPAAHQNINSIRIRRNTGTGDVASPSQALYVQSIADAGFTGALRGANITTHNDGEDDSQNVALTVINQMNAGQPTSGKFSIGVDIRTTHSVQSVSSISGRGQALEATVEAYLDDDFNSGEGGRFSIKAACKNLDIANTVGTAYFGAGVRVSNHADPTLSGLNWFKKGVSVFGSPGNGGIEDGVVVERVKTGLRMNRMHEYGIHMTLDAVAYTPTQAPLHGIYMTGDPREDMIRLEGVAARPILSLGWPDTASPGSLALIRGLGKNSAGDWHQFSSIHFDSITYTAGAEDGRMRLSVVRGGVFTTQLTISDRVVSNVPFTSPMLEEIGEFTLNDDAVIAIDISGEAGGTVQLTSPSIGVGFLSFYYRRSTGAVREIAKNDGYTVNLAFLDETVLVGTTGTDGNLTISASSAQQKVYIENRLGAAHNVSVMKVGRRSA